MSLMPNLKLSVSASLFIFACGLCSSQGLPTLERCPDGDHLGFETACRSLALDMENGRLRPQFTNEWANSTFGVNPFGIAQIHTVVVTLAETGETDETAAVYSFNFKEVHIVATSNDSMIEIRCPDEKKKCITLSARGAAPIAIDNTLLSVSKDDGLRGLDAVLKSFSKISSFFSQTPASTLKPEASG